jgi:protein TonB
VVPDDLRQEAYQALAVARLRIHVDGTVEVSLLKATQNPRLNQIVLRTLSAWRFAPALEHGHPVESSQEVRVHFNVS